MKKLNWKATVTSLTLAAVLTLPVAAMAAEDTAPAEDYPLQTLEYRNEEYPIEDAQPELILDAQAEEVSLEEYVSGMPNLSEDEKKEYLELCQKLEEMAAQLDGVEPGSNAVADDLFCQMAPLEARLMELEEKACPMEEYVAEEISYQDMVAQLELSEEEKQELAAAYEKLDALWMETEPEAGDWAPTPEMNQLGARITELEMKAFVNSLTETDSRQEVKDAAEEVAKIYNEYVQALRDNALEEQLNALEGKLDEAFLKLEELTLA